MAEQYEQHRNCPNRKADCPRYKTFLSFLCEVLNMRKLLFAAVALVMLANVVPASAAWTIAPPGTEKSKEIHDMNIMDRPNRVLHFYGDTVRLMNRRRS
jgi:hypothetical protein